MLTMNTNGLIVHMLKKGFMYGGRRNIMTESDSLPLGCSSYEWVCSMYACTLAIIMNFFCGLTFPSGKPALVFLCFIVLVLTVLYILHNVKHSTT